MILLQASVLYTETEVCTVKIQTLTRINFPHRWSCINEQLTENEATLQVLADTSSSTPTRLPNLRPRVSRMLFPLFIICSRNKAVLSKNSPFYDPKSLKSHLPWHLRNRFLQSTTRSWWAYCWMHRKFAHWGNTVICSQLYSRERAESADHSGNLHISETPFHLAQNLQEISRAQNYAKLGFLPTCPFFFFEITYHFLGQSPLLHIHEEPGLGQNCRPQSLSVEEWFTVWRTIDDDRQLKSWAGLHPVPKECGVFKISHFPLDWSTKDLTLSVF